MKFLTDMYYLFIYFHALVALVTDYIILAHTTLLQAIIRILSNQRSHDDYFNQWGDGRKGQQEVNALCCQRYMLKRQLVRSVKQNPLCTGLSSQEKCV